VTRGRILVAHNSRAVRSILRRRALAEAPDFLIDEVESADEVVLKLKSGAFDIVICDEVLAGPLRSDWIGTLSSQRELANIGYIFLISESTSPHRKEELAKSGAHAFLDARCTASDIAAAIATVFDPRSQRQFRRVCIPGTQASIHLGSIGIGADVVNISVAGMLCDFACPSEFGAIILPCDVALRFPADCEPETIDGIRARMLRLHVVSRNADQVPERVRAAWQFTHVPTDSYTRLDTVLSLADEEAPPESRSLMA
jgi:hypothetical protein